MDEWHEVPLEEVADELTVGYVGSMASEYVDDGIPFLRSLNVEPLRINRKDLKHISPEFHDRIRKSRLTPGDVVIVRTGKPGACALIPEWLTDANCSDLVIVRCGERIDNRFLVYYINTAASSHVAAHLVGAVQQHFNVGSARALKIKLPPLEEQRAITAVLSSLDDKIDLLQRQNKTLESLAQTLFRHWFLDGSADDWIEFKLADFVKHTKESINPSGKPTEMFLHYSIPAFDNGKIPARELGSEIRSNKYKVAPFSILVSKLNPRFPRIWDVYYQPKPNSICSTEFQILTPKVKEHYGFVSFLLKSDDAIAELQMAASGTSGSHQRVKPEDILNISFSVPNKEFVKQFSQMIEPNLLKAYSNQTQIRTLKKLRDTLLPKLMSGEVRVRI